MAFWNDLNTVEPMRQHRWYFELNNPGVDKFRWALKECDKPSYDLSVTEHRLLTNTFKYPGTLKWKPINVKYVSAIDDTQSLDKTLANLDYLNYNNQQTFDQHQQIAKSSSFDCTITQINASGSAIETWNLNNAIISSVNYGTLSYENEGFVEVSLTLQYDWAKQNDTNIITSKDYDQTAKPPPDAIPTATNDAPPIVARPGTDGVSRVP